MPARFDVCRFQVRLRVKEPFVRVRVVRPRIAFSVFSVRERLGKRS
jgi:hypothetical protein